MPPQPAGPGGAANKPGSHTPRAAATFGMWLFLAALFMLFASSLLGYVFIRVFGGNRPAAGAVHMPGLLWASTAFLLGVSVAVHLALQSVRRERQPAFRTWLRVMIACAAGFLALQVPALWQLLASHQVLRARGLGLYGLVFFLVLIHALHVVGGIAWLVRITVEGYRGRYDHEHYQPVRHAAMYWHFLDAVWVVMFLTFLVLR